MSPISPKHTSYNKPTRTPVKAAKHPRAQLTAAGPVDGTSDESADTSGYATSVERVGSAEEVGGANGRSREEVTSSDQPTGPILSANENSASPSTGPILSANENSASPYRDDVSGLPTGPILSANENSASPYQDDVSGEAESGRDDMVGKVPHRENASINSGPCAKLGQPRIPGDLPLSVWTNRNAGLPLERDLPLFGWSNRNAGLPLEKEDKRAPAEMERQRALPTISVDGGPLTSLPLSKDLASTESFAYNRVHASTERPKT